MQLLFRPGTFFARGFLGVVLSSLPSARLAIVFSIESILN